MNAHNAIVDAVEAALKAAPALAAGHVESDRTRPIDEDIAQFIGIVFGRSDPSLQAIRGNPRDWTTEMRLFCWSRASATESARRRALDLAGAVFARLQADPLLAGAAWDVQPGSVQLDPETLDTTLACAVASHRVRHRTAGNTLEV
jgi:hypothetical protein